MSVQPQFIFGGNTGVSSPEELARLRAISMALSQPAAPKNVGEGLSALGQALGYRLMQSKMGKMQAEGNASASDAISQALNGGTFPSAPGGGASPVASALSGPPADGAAPSQSASSGPPSDIEAYIRQSAAARGIDPDVAVTVAKSEGGLKDPTRQSLARKNGVQEPSYGPFQLLVGGGQTGFPAGMGNQALAAGIDPRDPANWQKGVDFALDQAKQKGWGQWYGAKAAGITGMHGIGNAPIAAAAPQQVASLDPSVGMPAAPSPVAAALQLPQQGPIPQGRPDVAAALNGAPPANGPAALPDAQFNNRFAGLPMMGGPAMPAGPVVPAGMAPMPQPGVDPSTTAAMAPGAVPPLPAREIGPDPMGAAPDQSGKPQGPGRPGEIRKGADGKTYQYVQTTGMAGATGDQGWIETSMAPQGGGQPAPDNLPVMAGGSADAVQPGNGTPSMQDLIKLASNPWAMQKYGPIIQTLLAQQMKQTDPAYALDIAGKRAQLALDQQKLGGSFRGDSMDAQAWNILQTRDPSSKEYQTAYAIVSQPKTQLVQTANGMVPVQVPPQLPSWLKAPGDASGAPTGPAAAVAAPGAEAAPQGAGGPATPGTAIPGTKQPATETQARNGAISRILLNEVPTLGKTFQALADPKGQLLNALPGGVGNPWQSEEYQRAATAVKTSIANVLYSLSGASSNPGEVMKQIEVLTPAFGDKPGTITDKLNRFKTYVRSIATESNDPELQKSIEDALSQMDGGTAPAGTPKAGAVEDGYRFKGGDPADQKNWEPVQ